MSERLGKLPKDYEPSKTSPPQSFGPRQKEPFSPTKVAPAGIGNAHGTSSSMRNQPKSNGTLCPFVIYLTGETSYKIGNGYVVTSVSTGAKTTPTGLSTERTLSSSTKVWLKATFTEGLVLTGIEVGVGSAWPNPMVSFTGTPPAEYQQYGYAVIGEVASGELPDGQAGFGFQLSGSDYHFRQWGQTNFVLAAAAVDGKAAKIFLPFA